MMGVDVLTVQFALNKLEAIANSSGKPKALEDETALKYLYFENAVLVQQGEHSIFIDVARCSSNMEICYKVLGELLKAEEKVA